MSTPTFVPPKKIVVRQDVYEKLLKAKKDDETFSDVIDRYLEGKRDIWGFAGALATDRDFEKVEEDIALVRSVVPFGQPSA